MKQNQRPQPLYSLIIHRFAPPRRRRKGCAKERSDCANPEGPPRQAGWEKARAAWLIPESGEREGMCKGAQRLRKSRTFVKFTWHANVPYTAFCGRSRCQVRPNCAHLLPFTKLTI